MTDGARILLVDDHADIREALTEYLHRYDMSVTTASDGQQMRKLLEKQCFDLILLDVKLPGEDGLSLCRYVYEHLKIPVILLTALGEAMDRITGLELGADDYMTKPFEPRELVARIRSVFRRIHANVQQALHQPAAQKNYYQFDKWLLDIQGQILLGPDEEVVDLSRMEFRLLKVLLEHPQTVFSRDKLLDLINDNDGVVFDRSIDSQISRLRKKLKDNGRSPQLLRTAWGDGYLLASDVRLVSK